MKFQRATGVDKTYVGYTDGDTPNPNYDKICTGRTGGCSLPNRSFLCFLKPTCCGTRGAGYAEAVQCIWDPTQTTYGDLVDTFFDHVDPTTLNRQVRWQASALVSLQQRPRTSTPSAPQGNDVGTQYRSAIYYHSDEQRRIATEKIEALNKKLAPRKIVTTVQPATDFYIAEKYHQQYLAKGGRFGMAQSASKGCTDPIRY